MGSLYGSFSRGSNNHIGMMGEILVHRHIKGQRVGDTNYAYDIELPTGITVDVKTVKASGPPLPHYVARVYGAEDAVDRLRAKCDVYYFVRCNTQLSVATIVGWLPSREFFDKALFLPKGHVNPDDGKLTYSDEFSVPISELLPPTVRITKKRLALSR